MPLNIKQPAFSTQWGEELPLKIRAVGLRQMQRAYIQTELLDEQGKAVDLTDYGISPTGDSSSSSSSSGASSGQVDAVFYEGSLRVRTVYRVQAQVLDAAGGVVKVFVPAEVRDCPGVYRIDIGVLNSDGALLFDNSLWAYVERSGWGDPGGPVGPQLLSNIRASLAESDPLQSLLREEYVYDLSDICYAAVRAVQWWNESPPPVSNAVYSTQSFPFPEIWLSGIQLFLFEAAEEWYRRNKFQFQAGGMSSDDLARDREYKAAWQERFAEWRRKVMHKKAQLNADNAFRALGSGYTLGQVSAING